jgi:hypothetical protein
VLVQIDFLRAEGKRDAALAEFDPLHAHDPRVKLDAVVDVGDSEYQVVDSLDVHRRYPLRYRVTIPDYTRSRGRKNILRAAARG